MPVFPHGFTEILMINPGYQDSGADVAYTLHSKGVNIVTPKSNPSPTNQEDWCFPDSEEGILTAIAEGATHLWANTIVFSSHPLQTSSALEEHASTVRVIGQPPGLVEKFDDKLYLNDKLRSMGDLFTLPRSWEVKATDSTPLDAFIQSNITTYPIVGKPVRGRGSHGVKVCHGPIELKEHIESLFEESPVVLLEEFLAGEEATVTVMPPSASTSTSPSSGSCCSSDSESDRSGYWSMVPVMRYNHDNGIAPYNGTVAVTANSRVVSDEEMARDPAYGVAMRQCERVAGLIKATAPIRIDIRRFETEARSQFAIFDINMKPVCTCSISGLNHLFED
jgi:hypothetical protein